MVLWGRWLAASLLSRPSAGTCGGRGVLSVAVAARCQELVFEFRNFFEFRFFFPTSCQEVFQHEIQQAAAGCRVSAGLLALWSSKKEMVPLLVPNGAVLVAFKSRAYFPTFYYGRAPLWLWAPI